MNLKFTAYLSSPRQATRYSGKVRDKNLKIKYDTEADVLSWEISGKGKIDYASELNNIVVHFTKKHIPVLIEVLEASKLLKQSEKTVEQARDLALTH